MFIKHYIRVDAQGSIVKGFSDAFEQPIEGDICICDNGGRQFEMDYEVNPPLFNADGKPLYKYENELIVKCTIDELALTTEEKINAIRAKRNVLISETDWLMLPDVPITAENRTQWEQYRQALRDLPDICDPDNPIWPTKPSYITV
jgi:hypothetical protein